MTTSTETKGYSEYIVAFLDVLGLTDAIKESVNDAASCVNIARLLSELQEIAARRTQDFHDIKVSSFSDSIIISCPTISEQSFRFVLRIVSEFCLTATVSHGFFVRGALTIGPHWEDEGVLFGPAFIRAYEMEQSLALWPRCIIDPVVLTRRDICPSGSWKKRYLYVLVGSDGLPYLDYLGYAFHTYVRQEIAERGSAKSDSHRPNPHELILKVAGSHKRAIYRAVQDARQNKARTTLLLTKYYPLALYHNTVIRRLTQGAPKSSEYNKVAPNSWAGRFVSHFESIATEAGIGTKVIDQMKREFLVFWARSREQWRGELIDLDTMFAVYGDPTLSEPKAEKMADVT